MESMSEYEAKRLRRMQENKRKLESLNLPTLSRVSTRSLPVKTPVKSAEPVRRSGRVQTLRQQQKQVTELQEQQLALIAFERQNNFKQQMLQKRSERAAGAPTTRRMSKIVRGEGEQWTGHRGKQARAMEKMEAKRQSDLKRMTREHPPPVDLPFVYACQFESGSRVSAQHSTRLTAEVETFHDMCLGKQILPEGKKAVMQALCPNKVLFPMLSSVQLWRNAMVLFVDDEEYRTRLHEEELDGKKVVYFEWLALLIRQKIPESTVQRLRQVQKGDERLRFDESYYGGADTDKLRSTHEPLLLFLQQSKGPYIYCGRLGYLGHSSSEIPSFRFQLLDLESLDWGKVFSVLTASDDTVKL